MALYKPVIIDINTLLVANIATIIPSGTASMIDWNEGQPIDHTSNPKFIQPIISMPAVAATEIYKLTVFGQLTINYFEETGNNINGAGIADILDGIFVDKTLTDNAVIRWQRSEIIANEPDPETGHFLTSWRVTFEAQEV